MPAPNKTQLGFWINRQSAGVPGAEELGRARRDSCDKHHIVALWSALITRENDQAIPVQSVSESSMARRIDPAVFFGDPNIHANDPEPRLEEMLCDPVFHRLMRSDGVSHSALLTLVAVARRRLRRPPEHLVGV
jgi:hypothetical protein